MSKAEEKAQAVYPSWRNGLDDKFNSSSAYCGFIEGYQQAEKDLHKSIYKAGVLDGFEDAVEGQYEKGYEQAEKDLELTWEDIALINDVVTEMLRECGDNILYDTEEEFCREALKRFKEMKEK